MRISIRAALVTGAAALGLVGGALAPAQADTGGFERCPDGSFCVFDGSSGQGSMAAYSTPQTDLGAWTAKASSVYNRTGSKFFCMFSSTGYQYNDAVHDAQVDAVGDDLELELAPYTTGNSRLDDNLGSVRWAATRRLCDNKTEYLPWESPYPRTGGPAHPFDDLNRDGHADLLNRTQSGKLYFLPGDGTGQLIGGGWNSMTALTRHGDLSGDGAEDLLARDTAGKLWLYPGTGRGRFGARLLIGGGWNVMTRIQAVGDLNGDAKGDLLARDTAGQLWMYPGNGSGLFGARTLIGGGWNVMQTFAGAGDLNADGRSDLVVSDSSGKLFLYPGNGKGWLGTRVMIGSGGWGPFTTLIGIGNITADAYPDLIAVQSLASGGELRVYYGQAGGHLVNNGKWGTVDEGDLLF